MAPVVSAPVGCASGSQHWCATDFGIYRAPASSLQADDLKFELVVPGKPQTNLNQAAFADSQGRLCFSIDKELIEIV